MKFTESLKKHEQFKEVYDAKISYANKYLVLYIKENQTEINRLGITATKKIGNSIVRHRFKRLVRESYRLNEEMLSSGLDIVVVARNTVKGASFHEIESALLHLCKLHKIIKSEEKGL